MKTALRTMFVATGIVATLGAAPAMAQMSQADQQRIARILADQGYSRVSVSELDRDVIVMAARGGNTQVFAYDTGRGQLVLLGNGHGGIAGVTGGTFVADRGNDQ